MHPINITDNIIQRGNQLNFREWFIFYFSTALCLHYQIIDDFRPFTYNYLLGDSILVAPLYSEGSINATISVPLPDNQTWVYWWNHSMEFTGKADIESIPLDEYPVFFVKGTAILNLLSR